VAVAVAVAVDVGVGVGGWVLGVCMGVGKPMSQVTTHALVSENLKVIGHALVSVT
jgi:hypothetical protein